MKLFYSILFLSLLSFSSFSQDKKDIAKIYFKKAKESYLNKDFTKTERYLSKTIEYFDGIKTEEIAIFGSKFFFENQKYTKAKEYLTAFFKLNKSKKTQNYSEMLILYTDTLDAIDNPEKFKKQKKIVSPKNITKNDLKDEVNKIDVIKVNDSKKVTNIIEEEDFSDQQGEDDTQVKDVSFAIIEDVPVFPGCTGNKTEKKDCFSKMVQVHFSTFFNADLPNTLGLTPGRKRIFIAFLINTEGKVVNIKANAPHPLLKKEVVRVMNLMPIMEPGMQNGKEVNVKYSIPFTIIVE